jgi:hypothetical protein
MSRALNNCKVRPGWVKSFLGYIKLGYNEKNAANLSGVGTGTVQQRCEKHPDFRVEYEELMTNQKPRPGQRSLLGGS